MRTTLTLIIALLISTTANAQRILTVSTDGDLIVDAYYEVETGKFLIDSTSIGTRWSGYLFEAAFPLDFSCDEYRPFFAGVWSRCKEHHTVGTDGSPGEFESQFSDYLFLESEPTGIYSVGNILPVGLSEQGFYDFFVEGVAFGSVDDFEENVMAIRLNYGPAPGEPLNDDRLDIDINWAENVDVIYNTNTGQVDLSADGEFGGYGITFRQPIVLPDEFVAITDAPGNTVEIDSESILELGRNPIPAGYYPIGTILPTGFTAESIAGMVSNAFFVAARPGRNLSFSRGEAMGISVVPEPAMTPCLAVVLLIGLGILRRQN